MVNAQLARMWRWVTQQIGGAGTAMGRGGLLAASLAGAVCLGEGLVRLLEPQQLILIRPDLWQPADSVGWLHRPNVATTINTGERTVVVRTDAHGFRVGKTGRQEAPSQILLLGDSFMEALQVEYEESLAGELEMRLSTGDARVAIRNGAVGGWEPEQYLIRARSLLRQDSFDLVVVALFVGNDVQLARVGHYAPRAPVRRHVFRTPRELSWSAVVRAWLAPVNDALEVRSHLFVLAKNRLRTVRMRLGLYPVPSFPVEFLRSEAASERWSVTADLCRELASLAEQNGVPALFVLIPAAHQVDRREFDSYVRGFRIDTSRIDLEQPNRLLHQELRERGVMVVDALAHLRREHEAGKKMYGSVDHHLTAEGHRAIATLLEPAAAALLNRSPMARAADRHASGVLPPAAADHRTRSLPSVDQTRSE